MPRQASATATTTAAASGNLPVRRRGRDEALADALPGSVGGWEGRRRTVARPAQQWAPDGGTGAPAERTGDDCATTATNASAFARGIRTDCTA